MNRILAVFFLLASLSALVYVETEAHAQVAQLARPFNGYVNKAVASTLSKRLTSLGFAANDPIYAATMTAAQTTLQGAVAVGSVASTVAAIGTAPVWLSVALGLGAAYEIYNFTMGQYDFKADAQTQKVTIESGTITKAPPPPAPFTGAVGTFPTAMPYDYSDPGVGQVLKYPNDQRICATYQGTDYPSNSTATFCANSLPDLLDQVKTKYAQGIANFIQSYTSVGSTLRTYTAASSSGPTKTACSLSPLVCPEGVVYAYVQQFQIDFIGPSGQVVAPIGGLVAYSYRVFNNPNYIDTTTRYSLNDAVSRLQPVDLSSRADPELLAALANKIWQQAAQQPDYQGAPYDVNNPVTVQDIEADIASGLYPWPTVADLLTLTVATGQTAPQLDPAAQPVEQPAGQPSTTVVDLGPDPATPAPGLEAAPTGSTIVSHVMGLMPSFSAFQIPSHAAECSMPSFDFFGTQVTMTSACDLIEGQRALLSTLFTAIWGVSALVFVLRA